MKISFILLAVVFFSAFPVPGQADELSGNLSFTAGALFTADDFSKVFDMHERVGIGVMCDAGKETWPVSIIAAYFFSYGNSKTPGKSQGVLENKDTDIYCSETYIGIRKIFDSHSFIKPYLDGGLYSVNMYADISYDHEYDGAFGGWYGAGAYVTISKSWHLNLEWRRSKARVDLFDSHLDAGGDYFGLSIGYHFPQ